MSKSEQSRIGRALVISRVGEITVLSEQEEDREIRVGDVMLVLKIIGKRIHGRTKEQSRAIGKTLREAAARAEAGIHNQPRSVARQQPHLRVVGSQTNKKRPGLRRTATG